MCLRLVAPPQGGRLGRRARSRPSHWCPALQNLPQGATSLRSGEWHIYTAVASRAAGSKLPSANHCHIVSMVGRLVWVLVDTAGAGRAPCVCAPPLLLGFTHGC